MTRVCVFAPGPLPGNPVNYVCAAFSSQMSPAALVGALYSMANTFLNYTGAGGSCFDISDSLASSAAKGGVNFDASDTWTYQTCTEQVLPQGQNGLPNDILYSSPWSLSSFVQECQAQFGSTPRPDWILNQFGGINATRDFSATTNIVFSNGDRDPWSR